MVNCISARPYRTGQTVRVTAEAVALEPQMHVRAMWLGCAAGCEVELLSLLVLAPLHFYKVLGTFLCSKPLLVHKVRATPEFFYGEALVDTRGWQLL